MRINYRGVIFLLSCIFTIPFLTIFFSWLPQPESIQYFSSSQFSEAFKNTAQIVSIVFFLTLALGGSSAYLIARTQFKGKKIIEILLYLPLAIPPYINAFIYLENLEYEISFMNIRSTLGVSFILSISLFPYVYLTSKEGFLKISNESLITAKLLCNSSASRFFKIFLPISSPFIFIGSILVVMECLSDFGAVSLYSVETFTTLIYESWFGLFDLIQALRISSFLLIISTLVLYFDAQIKNKKKYYEKSLPSRDIIPYQLSTPINILVVFFFICLLFLSLFFPIYSLIRWSFTEYDILFSERLYKISINSLFIACLGASIILGITLAMNFISRLLKKEDNISNSILSVGYSLPGTVLGISILISYSWLDRQINHFIEIFSDFNLGLLFTGSIFGMLVAYLIRFYAIGYQNIKNEFRNITPNIDLAYQLLKPSNWKLLFKIHLPAMKGGLLISFSLLFIEIVKEMPASIILRPFGFDTLSTWIWQLSSEDLVQQASIPSLIIISLSLLITTSLLKLSKRI